MAHPHPLRFVFPFRDFPGKLGNTYFDTEVEIIFFTLLHVLRSQAIPGYHNENSLILFAAVFYQEGFHSTSSITVAKQWHQGQSPRRKEPCHRGAVGPKPENSRFCGIGGQFYHSAEPKTNRPNRTLYNTKAKNLSILRSRVFRLRNQRMKVPRRALFPLASTNAAFTLLRALFDCMCVTKQMSSTAAANRNDSLTCSVEDTQVCSACSSAPL